MISLIMVCVISTIIDNILDSMGVPQSDDREQKSQAISQCIVSMGMGKSAKDAISELYLDLGVSDWRNDAMTNATIEALNRLKGSNDLESDLLGEVEWLKNGANFVGLEL